MKGGLNNFINACEMKGYNRENEYFESDTVYPIKLIYGYITLLDLYIE